MGLLVLVSNQAGNFGGKVYRDHSQYRLLKSELLQDLSISVDRGYMMNQLGAYVARDPTALYIAQAEPSQKFPCGFQYDFPVVPLSV